MRIKKSRRISSKGADIAGAEKKLRQAEFFLRWLEDAPNEISRDRFRGVPERVEHLAFYFSACLSAAQSVYYILQKTAKQKFDDIEQEWKDRLKDDPGGCRFERMKDLRDGDVHVGETGAKPLEKYIEDDPRGRAFPYHQPQVRNAALFGHDQVQEVENPDGAKVRGSVLRGAVGLYLDRDGKPIEATTACREFIEQLRSLLDATRAAVR